MSQTNSQVNFHARAYWGYLTIALVVIVLDQLSKRWIVSWLDLYDRVELLSFFGWVHMHNYGAAFSFLNKVGGAQVWFFGGVAVVMSIVLLVWLRKTAGHERQLSWALALVLGGAIGNLIDRVLLGYVIDFIWVHYQDWHFPAFNIADSAITIGAVLLLADSFGVKLIPEKSTAEQGGIN